MCSQLWFLTDRRIREDYPQVQILRALRQRCSEQDVRFRAVLMDQIAVTVVGGHLGKRSWPRDGGEARRDPPSPSQVRGPETSRSPSQDPFELAKAPNLESFLGPPPSLPGGQDLRTGVDLLGGLCFRGSSYLPETGWGPRKMKQLTPD